MFCRLYIVVFTILSFFLILSPQDASAQKINDKEAALLKTEIQKTLEFYNGFYAAGGAATLKWDGDILVEPADKYYAVTLPDLTIIDHQKQQEIHVGMIAANAIPVEKKDANDIDKWNLSVALPTPILAHRNGKVVGQVDAREQKISILWAPALKQMIDADITLDDVVFADYTTGLSTLADSFKLERNFRKDGKQNTWTGFDRYTIENILLQDQNKTEIMKAKKIVAKSDLQNMDFQKALDMQKRYGELSKGIAENKSGIDTTTVIDFIGQGLGLYAGQKAMFHVEDAYVYGAETGRALDIDTIDGLVEMTGKGKGFVKSKVWLENVMSYTLTPQGQKQVSMHSPFNVVFDGSLNNLPELKDFKSMIQNTPITNEQGQPTGFYDKTIKVGELLTLLNKTGTLVTINEVKAESALSSMALTGNTTFHPDAQWGVQSNSVLTFQGLDKLSQAVTAEGGEQGKQAMAIIQMLQSMGKVVQQGSATKPEIVTFNIDVGKDGTLLLNGTNIAPLLAMLQPQLQQMQQQGQ